MRGETMKEEMWIDTDIGNVPFDTWKAWNRDAYEEIAKSRGRTADFDNIVWRDDTKISVPLV